MKRIFLYLKYYFELPEKELQEEAYAACKTYYRARPLRNKNNPYPRPIEYQRRLDETVAFQRGYKNQRRHLHAISQLNSHMSRYGKIDV